MTIVAVLKYISQTLQLWGAGSKLFLASFPSTGKGREVFIEIDVIVPEFPSFKIAKRYRMVQDLNGRIVQDLEETDLRASQDQED